ncbi:MAG: hypothetical protein P4L28_02005 [Paludibacteraceae bacterium]|nr:hypothetical protein [Paludibacteraceae bacterium]
MKKIILCYFLAFSPLFFLNVYCSGSQTEVGVVINGVRWATRNVAAPGTFATNPEDAGMFYQWNSKVGWSATGEIGSITATDGSTTWNSSWTGGYTSPSSSDTWTSTNDPSPVGWRVPTYVEIKTLLDTTKVTTTWITQSSSVYGRKFTDKTTGNSIFLPAPGFRVFDSGTLVLDGLYGGYWSNTTLVSRLAYDLDFGSSGADWYLNKRADGFSVRSVIK